MSKWKSSSKLIGSSPCLEHVDNPHWLRAYGKGGYIERDGKNTLAVITRKSYFLRDQAFTDLSGDPEQDFIIGDRGLPGMIRHLEIDSDLSSQKRLANAKKSKANLD